MAQYNIQPLLNQVQLWWSQQQPAPGDTPSGLNHLFNPYGMVGNWQKGRSRVQLANELRSYVKADSVRASGMLQQPDAKVALQVANLLLPKPLSLEVDVIVDAIELAGADTVADRRRALVGLIGAGASLLLFSLLFSQRGSS